MNLCEPRGEWKLEAQGYEEFVIDKASRSFINGYGGNRCSAITFGAPEDHLFTRWSIFISDGDVVRRIDAEMEERMSGAGYVVVNGFERSRTAPTVRSREVEVRAGRIGSLRSGRTPPKRNPAMLLQASRRPRRPAAPKRGQVRAAIAHSLLQTLSSIVQGARDVALRRSFSWHS
jgi:hypothetical protein